MSTYPKYKPVTFEYVKQIPDDWGFLPNIALFEESKQKGFPNEELLAVSIKKGVTKTGEIDKKDSSNEDKSNYKLLNIGEIAYNPMRMWQGALGLSPYKGIVSPAYIVLKAKKTLNTKFYHYLFRTNFYTKYSKQHSYGLCDDQLKLRYPQFKRMYSFVPPIETQNLIVAYLEEKEKQIKKFIKKKKELIQKLEDQKVTILTKLFLGSLDSSKKEKTENELIPYLPVGWKLVKLKYLLKEKMTYGANEEGNESNPKNPRYIRITDFDKKGFLRTDTYRSLPLTTAKKYLLNEGDILFARSGGTVGKAFLFNNYDGLACYAGYLIKAVPNTNKVSSKYLYYYTFTSIYENWKNSISNVATIENIGADKYSNLSIPVPTLDKQKQVIEKYDFQEKEISSIINRTQQEIKLAEDLLKSQIEQVVTGKIQVPNTFNDYINIAAEPITTYKTL